MQLRGGILGEPQLQTLPSHHLVSDSAVEPAGPTRLANHVVLAGTR